MLPVLTIREACVEAGERASLLLGFNMQLLAWAWGSSFSLTMLSTLPVNPHPVLARSPLLPLTLTFVSHRCS